MLYEDIVRFSQLIIDGLKTPFVIGGFTISWYQVLVFEIVMSILIMVIIGIVKED